MSAVISPWAVDFENGHTYYQYWLNRLRVRPFRYQIGE